MTRFGTAITELFTAMAELFAACVELGTPMTEFRGALARLRSAKWEGGLREWGLVLRKKLGISYLKNFAMSSLCLFNFRKLKGTDVKIQSL